MKRSETAKIRNRTKLIEYLGNPENEFCSRAELSVNVLGYCGRQGLYRHFSADEITEIENEALVFRRKRFARMLERIDDAVMESAANGDVRAAKLVCNRFEGWKPGQRIETVQEADPLKRLMDEIAQDESRAWNKNLGGK